MKIKFLRNILIEIYKRRLDEHWDKEYKKWDEIEVESIPEGKAVDIRTTDGDILYGVPSNSFTKV
jgi:hypothetical protein